MSDPRQQEQFADEADAYLDKHNVYQLFGSLLKKLAVEQPKDPYEFLIEQLQSDALDVPNVCVVGPPGSERTHHAREICLATGAVHVSLDAVLNDEAELGSNAGQSIKEAREAKQSVADDVVASLVATRLQRADARAKGWVLDGAPQTGSQARALQAAGVLADKLVVLQLDGKEAVARALASAERPGSESADVLREVQAFERGLNQFLPLYHNRTLLADAAQPREAVAQEVVAFVGRREPSRAPRRPTRALVLGPAGAGKATLCKRLVRQHGLLHVAVGPLLRREMARDAAFAKSIAPFVQAGQLVPDELVCPLVTERLQQSDCRKKGWVLDGFPRTEAQADVLAQQGLTPTRVVWLEAAQDVCRDRLVHRRVDAFSGAVYHLQEAPPNETVQKRLVHMQRDRPEVLANVWANFEAEAPALQTRYADRLRVVSGTRTPDQVLVEVESFLRRALGEPE